MQTNKFTTHAGQLVFLLSRLDQSALDMEQRRLQLISELAEWIDAKVGFWGWGRGSRKQADISPITSIPIGFSEQQWATMGQLALSPESERLFNAPIRQRLSGTSHVTLSRSLVWDRDTWAKDSLVKTGLHTQGWDEWLCSVNYFQAESWVNLTYFRELGKPDFDSDDCALVHLILGHVAWMRSARRRNPFLPSHAWPLLNASTRSCCYCWTDSRVRKSLPSSR